MEAFDINICVCECAQTAILSPPVHKPPSSPQNKPDLVPNQRTAMETEKYGNKGLCGVPSLPQCSLFWENGRLSTGGKIGIGLSCLHNLKLLQCVTTTIPPSSIWLISAVVMGAMAAKRNRYQRQKSLMLLEMESQHAKGSLREHREGTLDVVSSKCSNRSCAVSTRNDFLSIDFWAELAMSDSTVYLCSYREYRWSNLGFHIIKDHIITNKV
ncbi:hypothetical protein NC652_021281 [Populus alba x Populus x berolinensis]|nr:hypothetical protein NC652_021281 [Populus alba x Populus x berolinensis]